MVKVQWTLEAERWLQHIHDYIVKDSRISAKKVVSEICNKIELLRDFPEIGYKYRDEKEGELRILLYGHYRIAYLLQKKRDTLHIIGIFHGALDIERCL